MGISLSMSVVEPTCDCCDKLVMYVLNWCKSECRLSKRCTCHIEVVNHSAEDFVVEENNNATNNLFLITIFISNLYFRMYLLYTLYFTVISFNRVLNVINRIGFKVNIDTVKITSV